MRKKKIAFVILESGLCVPAKMGGAIETLMTILLEKNEKCGNFDFVFIFPASRGEKTYFDHAVCYGCTPERGGGTVNEFVKKVWIKMGLYFPRIFPRVSRYYRKACRIAKREKADCIIAEGILAEQFLNFAYVWKKEALAIHLHSKHDKTSLYDKIFGKTIAASQYIAEQWNESTPQQWENTYVLKNCIELERFNDFILEEKRSAIRKVAGFSQEDFVVVFCGRLVAEKGVKELIKAILSIEDERVKLLLIGSDDFARGNRGKYAQEVEELVLQSKGRIFYSGYIENSFLYQYYQSSDLQVVPSKCEEAAGLVVLEGMMSKVPLVITRSGGMVEYVDKEYTEIIPNDENLVENLRDKIIKLKNDPDKRRRMAEGAYNWARQFSGQKYYDDFCAIMNDWHYNKE